MRWEDGPDAGGVPAARATLFRYPSKRTLGRIPRQAAVAPTASTRSCANVSKRYAGKEIRLSEYLRGPQRRPLLPELQAHDAISVTTRGKDLYVRYRTRVKRIRK